MKDPVSKCDCITIEEFTALYNHGKGPDCTGDGDGQNQFIFNFFGPVYTVNGVANDQVVKIRPDCTDCPDNNSTKTTTIENEMLIFGGTEGTCVKTFDTVVTTFDLDGN